MEFVPLSDTTLRLLALDDPWLKCVFRGVVPSDCLPKKPGQDYSCGTHRQHKSGRGTGPALFGYLDDVCEVLDSYGLP